MSVLVVAEHDNSELKPATLSVVTAAQAFGEDVDILIAGSGCAGVADQAAKVAGVAKVMLADAPQYANMLAEPMAALLVPLAGSYSAVLAVANTVGKNFMPRVAAKLDVSQISEISDIESADTFVRPIYAGNAMATVQSSDAVKIITVRTTAFAKAEPEGGSAAVEAVEAAADPGLSSFVGEELSKSERPELTAARVIISGGRGM
ncbi:MAG: electron transfer flavoprotein subunit alpha/FixB family protein, partial [Alphaproteobacteria bacterium]|nr:electron transfer flavoprotein subunit alpha/FixB family protein [Alphaproteobacteria bacterium]